MARGGVSPAQRRPALGRMDRLVAAPKLPPVVVTAADYVASIPPAEGGNSIDLAEDRADNAPRLRMKFTRRRFLTAAAGAGALTVLKGPGVGIADPKEILNGAAPLANDG